METFAGVAAMKSDTSLTVREVFLKKEQLKDFEKFVKREGDSVKLVHPAEAKVEKEDKTIIYRTQDEITRKLSRIAIEEIEKCLDDVMKKATFVCRGKKYGTVEVRCATKEVAASLVTTVLRAENFIMWPTYKGRRGVQVKIPNIPPELKNGW